MSYVFFYYVYYVTCFQKQPPLFLKVLQIPQEHTCVGVSFFLEMMTLHEQAVLLPKVCFLIGWCYRCLKNIIDLMLFYGKHFSGFS